MTTPAWAAPANGFTNDLNSTNSTVGINQLLGAHKTTPIYQGVETVFSSSAFDNFTWVPLSDTTDVAQPFTLTSGTTIGRVQIPLQVQGNGANISVSLYSNNAGSPNIAAGALATTIVPASALQQVAASNGIPGGPALATGWQNTMMATGGTTPTTWASGSLGASTSISNDSGFAWNNGNGVFVGGTDLTSTGTTLVFSTQATSTSATSVPVPQPSTPITTQYSCPIITSDTIVVCGGDKAVSGVYTGLNTVFAASWNPNSGVIGAWSSQPALPANVTQAGGTAWNNHIYVIGGNTNFGGTNLSSVYHSSITNGQVATWDTYTPLPTAVYQPLVGVIGNWLVVAGGTNGTNSVTNVYYAVINSNGTLGNWNVGPPLPTAVMANSSGSPGALVMDDAFVIYTGTVISGGGASTTAAIQTLTFTPDGPAPVWVSYQVANGVTGAYTMPVATGTGGQWATFAMAPTISLYISGLFTPVPLVSVPLAVSGLTTSATYHIVVRQFGSTSASDWVNIGTNNNAFGNALQASRWGTSWSTIHNGYSVSMSIFDLTASGKIRHTLEDAGSSVDLSNTTPRWTEILYNYLGMPIGVLETTMQPNVALNSNPTFTTTTSPWTATGGALTRSNAQTHGGFPFSGLLTPTGGVQAFASTELIPITQTQWGSAQWLLGTGWFFSTTGYSNFSLNINWFDSGLNYLSTTFNVVALAANTWTQVNTYGQVPATAAFAALAPAEQGTPTSSNLLYISNAYILLTPETVGAQMSAVTVNYATGTFYPPVGATQLN